MAVLTPDIVLSQRTVRKQYVVRNCDEACTGWNYDTIVRENVCHESMQQTQVYKTNARRQK
jgi:hypothetical protein